MKNVLYIGNKLNSKTSNISGIQTLGPLLESEGFVMHYASSKSNKFLRLLDMVWSCLKLSKKVDMVLIDTYSTQNFYYALIVSQLCRILNVDYIPILHGGNLPYRLKKSQKWSRLIFKNAKWNVSPSMFLKKAFEAAGFDNIIHIPNAIEIRKYNFELKTYDTPKLLWVRSFSKIYNPEMAIYVLKELKDLFPDACLCMVGPDADGSREKVESLAKQMHLNVEITGKLKKKQWLKLSKNYNIFINTTNYDNTPVSVIEAMALGLPVVSTNVGGIPYLISRDEDGILVEPNQPKSMSSAITYLIENSETRTNIVKKARHKVEKYDWNQIKLHWIKALDSN